MPARTGVARLWRRLCLASAALAVAAAASLAPHLTDSAELVRLRNALLLQAEPAAYEWTPASVPADFALESAAPIPSYAEAVARAGLRADGDDWATALRIGQHLLVDGPRSGGAIQAGLAETYRRITTQGEGYCGDFADSFTGLATAAGVFARAWAFSFDGFGGRGHIFNEIWDRAGARWIMIDVFNNFYPADGAGRPLSAIEFRAALLRGASDLQLLPVDAAARPGFRHADKALDYYRRGLPEWYMWWGNNVFAYDRAPLVRALGHTHRALEQLGGVAAGVHPPIRVLASADNQAQREAMRGLRLRLLAVVGFGVLAALCLLGWLASRRPAGGRRR